MELLNTVWAIMVLANLQYGEPITSNYQLVKFESKISFQKFLKINKITLSHELIHALENLKKDGLVELKFTCVVDEGEPV